jgi:hypothetical protein
VLQNLQRALKCKEVWVEGASAFRNPHEDMPGDWDDEHRRMLHYQALGKPLDAQTFVRALRACLTTALAQFNRVLPHLSHLRIIRPKHKPEHGLWALAKLEPQPEPHSLSLIKDAISHRSIKAFPSSDRRRYGPNKPGKTLPEPFRVYRHV